MTTTPRSPERRAALPTGTAARWWVPLLVLALVVAGGIVAATVSQPDVVQALQNRTPTVWVTDQGTKYGRVNTEIAELDTVQTISSTRFSPTSVIQAGDDVVLVSGSSYVPVDAAAPSDLTDDTPLMDLPSGTQQVVSSGGWVVVRDNEGQVYAGTVADLQAGDPLAQVLPAGKNEADAPAYLAATVTSSGEVTAYAVDGTLLTLDLGDGVPPRTRPTDGPTESTIQDVSGSYTLTSFGEHWALLRTDEDAARGRLWVDGMSVATDLDASATLAKPGKSTTLYVATRGALFSYAPGGSRLSTVTSPGSPGRPATPMVDATGCVQAAWAGDAETEVSSCGASPVVSADDNHAHPSSVLEFRTNGEMTVLNDVSTGVVWSWSDGSWQVVPSTLDDWVLPEAEQESADQTDDVAATDNVCPVPARGDAAVLGVRAGSLARLPVLVAARDANPQDVLTVVPGSVSWQGKAWDDSDVGQPQIVDEGQALVVDVPGDATGNAKIRFQITDGGQHDGHDCVVDASATVQVHDDQTNDGPELLGKGAAADRPTVSVGSTVRVDLSQGWVDPDGDPISLATGEVSSGRVVAQPDGTAVYQPEDGQSPGEVQIPYSVTDDRGARTTARLTVRVSADAGLVAQTVARTVTEGVRSRIDLAPAVSGEDSALSVTDLSVTEADSDVVSAEVLPVGAAVAVTGAHAGRYTLHYTVSSGKSTAVGTLQLTVVADKESQVTSAPIQVFVREGQDVTVDPLAAVQDPGGLVLAVSPVTHLVSGPEASFEAETVGGATFRVASQGSTGEASKEPRAIGTFRYTLEGEDSDGDAVSAPGQATVYLLPDTPPSAPVAVDDQAVVRAGATVDIDVLENDVADAGSALVLDPRVRQDDDLDHGLAFPAGDRLRYLAPQQPGTYTVPYRVFTRGAPETWTSGTVRIVVRGPDTHNAPLPQRIEGRVSALGTVDLAVPRFGVDSDGDEVFATAVSQPRTGGQVQLIDDGSTLRVTSTATEGTIRFGYTVSDGTKVARGVAQVVVMSEPPQPVAFNDYLFGETGTEVAIDPVRNDTVPAGDVATLQALVRISGDGHRTDVALPAEGDPLRLPVGEATTRYEYTVVVRDTSDSGAGQVVGVSAAAIVVEPATASLPAFPVVSDTVIGPRQISNGRFTADVVTGKVVYPDGSVTAALVSDPAGVTLRGSTVSGPVTARSHVIPFVVQAPQAGSAVVVSYGFVRVPSSRLLRPEQVDPSRVYTVDEGSSVSIDLTDVIAVLAGKQLEVGDVHTDGLRPEASCTLAEEHSTTVVYRAGRGTQTRDGCSVEVRWRGDPGSRAVIHLGLRITLTDPAPTISRGVQILAVAPREQESYDLAQLVQWDRHSSAQVSELQFACSTPSQDVTVHCQGTQISASVDPLAVQGSVVDVSLKIVGGDGYPYSPPATSTVRIRVAPAPKVRIAVPVIQRTLTEGDSLSVDVGAEIKPVLRRDYFGWSGHVENASSQDSGVHTSVHGSSVQVTIDPGTPGGTKTVGYTFVDNPENPRPNHGTGTIEIQYRALPRTPGLRYVSGSDSSVILRVSETAPSSPQVQRFVVTGHGSSGSRKASCEPSEGSCDVTFRGLRLNEQYSFTAIAQSSVGDSAHASSTVVAWAYLDVPSPDVTWQPEVSGSGKPVVRLRMSGNENTKAFHVTGGGLDRSVDADAAGDATVSVTLGSFDDVELRVRARGRKGSPDDPEIPTAATSRTVHGVGPAELETPTLESDDAGDVHASAKVTPRGKGAVVRVGWAVGNHSCTPSDRADVSGSGGDVSTVIDAGDLGMYDVNRITVCTQTTFDGSGQGVDHGFDTSTRFGTSSARGFVVPFKVPESIDGVSYWVTLSDDGPKVNWTAKYNGLDVVRVKDDGWPTRTDQHVHVKICTGDQQSSDGKTIPATCSSRSYEIGPRSGRAAYAPKLATYFTHAMKQSLAACVVDLDGEPSTTSSITFPKPVVTDRFGSGSAAPGDWMAQLALPGSLVPPTYHLDDLPVTWSPSREIDGTVKLTVSFRGDLSGLHSITQSAPVTCVAPDSSGNDAGGGSSGGQGSGSDSDGGSSDGGSGNGGGG